MSAERVVRVVYPHQLFAEQLEGSTDVVLLLVEHDLLFRQYAFHAQKLVLHRASMDRFAERARERGFDVHIVRSHGGRPSRGQTVRLLGDLDATRMEVTDVVDDWLATDVERTAVEAGVELVWGSSPGFLTTRAQVHEQLNGSGARMQHFYSWQRRRLDILVDDGEPVGGRWSFDTENRKKLPRGHPVPEPGVPDRHPAVTEAIAWVRDRFPDAPGIDHVDDFAWPTSPEEAEAAFEEFLAERFAEFGPYEDAISTRHAVVFHALLTPALNIGLISPRHVVDRALAAAEEQQVPLASLEGFVRQVIGWREYMRATYVVWGRRMRTGNALEHGAALADGWWDATTGLDPVDHVVARVLRRGYAHHIERLMVLGNAMCLLRTDPDEVYEWFMALFIDAYDWVMVPNVYAMSQFAAGSLITTKPYVSGSNYLTTMSDFGTGEWRDVWDALYWTFVRDHRDVFESNPRSTMMTRMWDGMDASTKRSHAQRARPWLP